MKAGQRNSKFLTTFWGRSKTSVQNSTFCTNKCAKCGFLSISEHSCWKRRKTHFLRRFFFDLALWFGLKSRNHVLKGSMQTDDQNTPHLVNSGVKFTTPLLLTRTRLNICQSQTEGFTGSGSSLLICLFAFFGGTIRLIGGDVPKLSIFWLLLSVGLPSDIYFKGQTVSGNTPSQCSPDTIEWTCFRCSLRG